MELDIWQSETHKAELAKISFAHLPAFLELSSSLSDLRADYI